MDNDNADSNKDLETPLLEPLSASSSASSNMRTRTLPLTTDQAADSDTTHSHDAGAVDALQIVEEDDSDDNSHRRCWGTFISRFLYMFQYLWPMVCLAFSSFWDDYFLVWILVGNMIVVLVVMCLVRQQRVNAAVRDASTTMAPYFFLIGHFIYLPCCGGCS